MQLELEGRESNSESSARAKQAVKLSNLHRLFDVSNCSTTLVHDVSSKRGHASTSRSTSTSYQLAENRKAFVSERNGQTSGGREEENAVCFFCVSLNSSNADESTATFVPE